MSIGLTRDEYDAEVAEWEAELKRIKEALKKYLDGDYPNPRTYAKGSVKTSCPHGQFRWEDCLDCDTDYLQKLYESIEG
jgi:hypothetical protein